MRWHHGTGSQRKRRATTTSRTGRPASGKSVARRRYRLWMRSERVPHLGHALVLLVGRTVIIVVAPSQTALSTAKPSGMSADGRRAYCMMLILPPKRGQGESELHQK